MEYESSDGNIIRYRFVNGENSHRYFFEPGSGKYRYPLWIGKEWKSGYTEHYATSPKSRPEDEPGARRRKVYQHGRVVAAEMLDTLTGRKPALRIEWTIEYLNDEFLKTEKRIAWLSVRHGHLLKQMTWEVGDRAKTFKVLELLSIQHPGER